MKKLLSFLLAFCLIFVFAGCGTPQQSTNDGDPSQNSLQVTRYNISVACLKGPTGLGMLKLMEEDSLGTSANDYTFTVASSADELTGKITTGEINITSVPTNLAAKLNKKTNGQIVMLAVNTLGTLSFIENGNTVNSVNDLKGKTIYSTGEGSNPEYILKHILTENGINPDKDVTLKFVATNDELNAALISGKADIAMVPEPAATTVLNKKDSLRRALNVNEEWNKVSDSPLMMGCVIALKSYVESNPDAVASFLKEYETSITEVHQDVSSTANLAEKYEIIPSATIAREAIPNCTLTFVSGSLIQPQIEGYFNVLYSADPSSIGGSLPNADFYYTK